MSEYIYIPTISNILTTVKFEDTKNFRPSATEVDVELAKVKVLMEKLEIDSQVENRPGYISSSSHTDKYEAIKISEQEANERISVSAWWAFNRPALAKISNSELNDLLKKYEISNSYNIVIGIVESTVLENEYVAVSIIKNFDNFPYAVLGASSSRDLYVAIEKAFIESVQSWTASEWEKDRSSSTADVWNIHELQNKYQSILNADEISDINIIRHSNIVEIQTDVEMIDGKYLAWTYSKNLKSNRTTDLARLAMKQSEMYHTYTEHNH